MSERRVFMSEQEQLFKVLLEELQGLKTNMDSEFNGIKSTMETELNEIKSTMATELNEIKSTMATKKDIEFINHKLDKLSGKMDAQHIENINSDNRLLNEIQALKEGVLFVNRKLADAELEINLINKKQ
jgi:hypothetical protein